MYSMRANQTVGGDFQDSGSRRQNNLSIYAAVLSSERRLFMPGRNLRLRIRVD